MRVMRRMRMMRMMMRMTFNFSPTGLPVMTLKQQPFLFQRKNCFIGEARAKI